jgi:hypothetical protein
LRTEAPGVEGSPFLFFNKNFGMEETIFGSMERQECEGYKNNLLYQCVTNFQPHGTAVASIGSTGLNL